MISISSCRTPQVRDLAWSCFSACLMNTEQLADAEPIAGNCALLLTQERADWLAQLDLEPTPLLQHLSPLHCYRLGIYFEKLWHFFLQEDPAVELVAHNLPVHHEGKTLGEFDCIYYCHQRQRHVHLELAVKYYLGHRRTATTCDHSECSEWLGPNAADRLDLKVGHLMTRQIRLADHPVALRQLRDLGISQLDREVEIKGDLFRPRSDPLPAPRAFNPGHAMQAWLPIDQLRALVEERGGGSYQLLPRHRWLARAQPDPLSPKLDGITLSAVSRARLRKDSRPLLVAAVDDYGMELDRFFITPDHWPVCHPKRRHNVPRAGN